jgi:hypothetical protein
MGPYQLFSPAARCGSQWEHRRRKQLAIRNENCIEFSAPAVDAVNNYLQSTYGKHDPRLSVPS